MDRVLHQWPNPEPWVSNPNKINFGFRWCLQTGELTLKRKYIGPFSTEKLISMIPDGNHGGQQAPSHDPILRQYCEKNWPIITRLTLESSKLDRTECYQNWRQKAKETPTQSSGLCFLSPEWATECTTGSVLGWVTEAPLKIFLWWELNRNKNHDNKRTSKHGKKKTHISENSLGRHAHHTLIILY